MENEVIVENEGLTEETNQPRKKEALNLPAFYVPAEANLEVIGYFDAGYKRRYPKEPKEVKTVTIAQNRTFTFVPTTYGYPNTEDLDLWRAFLKICDEEAKPVTRIKDERKTLHPRLSRILRLPSRKLLRYAGRLESARERKAVRDWLIRNSGTMILGGLHIVNPKLKELQESGGGTHLFLQIHWRGEKLKDGKIAEVNYVELPGWFLSNYFHHYYKQIDISFHQRLSAAISKALYPIFDQGWYASDGRPFSKKYHDLTTLLAIPAFRYLSRVKQQLNPAHEELKRERFLADWEYVKDQRGKWTSVIRWWPGQKFFEDQQAREARRQLAEQIASKPNGRTPKLEAPPAQSNGHAGDPEDARVGERDAIAQLLAEDILAVLHDQGSRQFYLKVARILPEQDIRRILAEIKADILHNPASKVRKPAAIFTVRVKDIAREQGIVL